MQQKTNISLDFIYCKKLFSFIAHICKRSNFFLTSHFKQQLFNSTRAVHSDSTLPTQSASPLQRNWSRPHPCQLVWPAKKELSPTLNLQDDSLKIIQGRHLKKIQCVICSTEWWTSVLPLLLPCLNSQRPCQKNTFHQTWQNSCWHQNWTHLKTVQTIDMYEITKYNLDIF